MLWRQIRTAFVFFYIVKFATLESSGDYELTLEFFCAAFKIEKPNCTCTDPFIRLAVKRYPHICEKPNTLSPNITETEVVVSYEANYSHIYGSVTIIASFFAIFANSLVVAVAIKARKASTSYQNLIGQLGVCDLTFACLQLVNVIRLFWTNKWIYGDAMCKILPSFLTLGSLIAIGLIFIATLDRYVAIVHPFYWSLAGTKDMCHVLSICNLIIGIVTIIPRFSTLQVDEIGMCLEKWSNRSSLMYETYLMIAYFALPLITISCLHCATLRALQRSETNDEQNRRISYVLMTIVAAFLILTLPNRAIMLYFAYVNTTLDKDLYYALSLSALIPYSFHVAINPVIYSFMDQTWRKNAIELLKNTIRPCHKERRHRTTTLHNSLSNDARWRTSTRESMVSCRAEGHQEPPQHIAIPAGDILMDRIPEDTAL